MKHDEIFERLDPPPGGLAQLRTRLEQRSRVRGLAIGFGVAFAAVAIFFLVRRREPDPMALARESTDPSAIGLGLARMPGAAVAIDTDSRETTALAEVKTSDPHVAFYWVSSTTWER